MLDWNMSNHYYTRILICLLGMLLLAYPSGKIDAADPMKVAVIDGDTLIATGKHGHIHQRELIRLIGIDAPEIGQRPWGQRAKQHLQNLIRKQGGAVFLERDVEQRDRYGRQLAYAWLGNGILLNERMVRDGYALAVTIPPNVRYASRIAEAQKRARRDRAGLWKYHAFRKTPHQWRQENQH